MPIKRKILRDWGEATMMRTVKTCLKPTSTFFSSESFRVKPGTGKRERKGTRSVAREAAGALRSPAAGLRKDGRMKRYRWSSVNTCPRLCPLSGTHHHGTLHGRKELPPGHQVETCKSFFPAHHAVGCTRKADKENQEAKHNKRKTNFKFLKGSVGQ